MQLPTGTTYALASVYAAIIAVSAATNATEAVLTTANNTYAIGDYVEYSCAWAKANKRVFRVKAAGATSVTLEGFDTTLTTAFPVGGGVGSLRKISSFVPISGMLTFEVSGGDAKYVTVSPIESAVDISLPDGYNAQNVAMSIADDPSLPHHAALKAAADVPGTISCVKAALPAGGFILYNGIVSFDESPSMTKGQVMAVKAGLALQGRVVRYAS